MLNLFWRPKVIIISANFLFVFLNARIVSYFCKLRTLSLLLLQCSFPFPDEVNLVLADSACAIQSVYICQKSDLQQNIRRLTLFSLQKP